MTYFELILYFLIFICILSLIVKDKKYYDFYDNQNFKFEDEDEFTYDIAKKISNETFNECFVLEPKILKFKENFLKSAKIYYIYLLRNHNNKSYLDIPPPPVQLISSILILKRKFLKNTTVFAYQNVQHSYNMHKQYSRYTPPNVELAIKYLETYAGFPRVHAILPYYTPTIFPNIGGYITSYPDQYKRNVVITFRGSVTPIDFYVDIKGVPLHAPGLNKGELVHIGLYTMYNNPFDGLTIKDRAFRSLKNFIGLNNISSILITGHSLGCAPAVFLARDIVINIPELAPLIRLELFATPQLGNEIFYHNLYNGHNFARVISNINVKDPVPVMNPANLFVRMPYIIEEKGVTNILYDNLPDQFGSYNVMMHFMSEYIYQVNKNGEYVENDFQNVETGENKFTFISLCKVKRLCDNYDIFYPNKCTYASLPSW